MRSILQLPWRALTPSTLLTKPRSLQHLPNRITTRLSSNNTTTNDRITRLTSRMPRFLRGYLTPLRNAPLSHITAFIILHELTAIVPLFGLAAAFHYANWLPPLISEGRWVSEGTERFGKWLRKRGWIDDGSERGSGRWWGRGEQGVRMVVELGTAYAVTKALLPLRLVLSVWATPWFARWTVLPVTARIGRVFGRKKVVSSGTGTAAAKGLSESPGATGAVAGGAVPKTGK